MNYEFKLPFLEKGSYLLVQHGFRINLFLSASSHFLDIQRLLSLSHLKLTSRNGKFIRSSVSWPAWKLEISLGNISKEC